MIRSNYINSRPNISLLRGKEQPRPEAEAERFRRCSLEHARQNSEKKLATESSSSNDIKGYDSSNPVLLESIPASPRRPRRSSLKTSSTSSTSSSSISTTKFVTFSLDVNVRPIAPKSEAELKVLWLSKDERQAIQLQANADLKVLKRIAMIPKEAQATDPEVRAVRNSISIRGLEQFSSKKLHKALCTIQHDHRNAVLEAQDLQQELHRRYGHPIKDSELAKVSIERSQFSRVRATKQGEEDETAVMGYLGRSIPTTVSISSSRSPSASNDHHRSRSTSQGRRASQHHRRGSMPTTSIEMERAATRRSSGSTNIPRSATSHSLSTLTHSVSSDQISKSLPGSRSNSMSHGMKRVKSSFNVPGSRDNSMSHGMKRVQCSVDSLLTRATRGDGRNKNTPGANATFDDVVRPPSSITTPRINKADTALLEPFVYPRPSASRRNTVS